VIDLKEDPISTGESLREPIVPSTQPPKEASLLVVGSIVPLTATIDAHTDHILASTLPPEPLKEAKKGKGGRPKGSKTKVKLKADGTVIPYRRRKKPKGAELLPSEQKWRIVMEYAEGVLSVGQIAEKYGTSSDGVSLIVNRMWQSLTNVRESRALLSGDSPDRRKALTILRGTNLINQKFLAMLSIAPELSDREFIPTTDMTDPEAIYCWTYVHTGDNHTALLQAGLDIGLLKTKRHGIDDGDRLSYDKAVTLRGLYLRQLPHIAAYIKDLRERRFVDQDVSKSRIQSELIDQLEQMKQEGDPKYRKDILRTIELLGKTIGAFVERVEITEVDPAKALDELINMAKTATVKELTGNHKDKITEEWQVS